MIDCATSVNQRGKIERYGREEQSDTERLCRGHQGRGADGYRRHFKDMVLGKAALCPLGGAGEDLGGYKGARLGHGRRTPVHGVPERPVGRGDLRGGSGYRGEKKPMPLGHVFMAIDIEPLIGLDKFKANAGELLRGLRASTKDPNGPW